MRAHRLPLRMPTAALAAALGAAALLGGCAGGLQRVDFAPGTPRADVLARLGPPGRVVALADGERLQYSQQPAGQFAYMVDLDRSGRVVQARQVLTANEFARVRLGEWTRADIEREFGSPAMVGRTGDWAGDVLTFRWNDGSDMYFWVYLDSGNVVRRTQQGMEFINAPNRD